MSAKQLVPLGNLDPAIDLGGGGHEGECRPWQETQQSAIFLKHLGIISFAEHW